jgi:hypothetical protein
MRKEGIVQELRDILDHIPIDIEIRTSKNSIELGFAGKGHRRGTMDYITITDDPTAYLLGEGFVDWDNLVTIMMNGRFAITVDISTNRRARAPKCGLQRS